MEPNVEEALRYLGAGHGAQAALRQEVASVARELADTLQPRYAYRVFDLMRDGDRLSLAGANAVLSGETASRMLDQCDQAVLLVCTLGAQFDALLRAAQARDMARAVILDACGSALVEAGCDGAEREIAARFPNRHLTDRFSPGYGDLPLALQPTICAALDAPKRLGVYVTKSLLLNPGKSVTALIGLSDVPQMARVRGCDCCALRVRCTLREGGNTCAL
ncbi:MAG: methionine synthase [Clostridia bacterium]|nr:methionine synthase [Clostridia bacterium]